jgi:transposase
MTRATRCAEYTGATTLCLYLAFELGSNEWKLGFTTEPGAAPRGRTMPARELERLTREIADAQQWFGLTATTPVRSCYEAGRAGFWRHRYLTSLGITNVVVDSSSIEVNRRLRRAKSDGLDVRKLLGMRLRYHAGERAVWSVVRVPTVEQADRRQLHRERRTLKQERLRVANRMNGRLANQGLWLPPGTNIGAAAKTVRRWDGSPVPAALRARLERDWEHAQFFRTRILEWEREPTVVARPSTRSGSCSACAQSGRPGRGSMGTSSSGGDGSGTARRSGRRRGSRRRRTRVATSAGNKGSARRGVGTFGRSPARRPGAGCGISRGAA